MNSFASDQSEHKKEYFNLCIDISSSLKANRFLAFQTVQKICRGAAFHTFLCFFPTEEVCQLSKVSLTEHGFVHMLYISENLMDKQKIDLYPSAIQNLFEFSISNNSFRQSAFLQLLSKADICCKMGNQNS